MLEKDLRKKMLWITHKNYIYFVIKHKGSKRICAIISILNIYIDWRIRTWTKM